MQLSFVKHTLLCMCCVDIHTCVVCAHNYLNINVRDLSRQAKCTLVKVHIYILLFQSPSTEPIPSSETDTQNHRNNQYVRCFLSLRLRSQNYACTHLGISLMVLVLPLLLTLSTTYITPDELQQNVTRRVIVLYEVWPFG